MKNEITFSNSDYANLGRNWLSDYSSKEIFKAISPVVLSPKSGISMHYYSPDEGRVYRLDGKIKGLVNGLKVEEIDNSLVISENNLILIYDTSENYRYEIKGNEKG